MNVQRVIWGNTVKQDLEQNYEFILDEAATALSESEFKHFSDVANIGYEYASQKDAYIETIHDTISDWIAEDRRNRFHISQPSTVIDFSFWYNRPEEVKNQMKQTQEFNAIPAFFVYFGAVVLALFCISATVFVIGLCQNTFSINPVYLFMFVVGFLGLLLTDIVAVTEWRKAQNVQK